MKVYVKAWQNVINPSTQEVYDEFGLKVLDSLRYGPIRVVEKITPEIREEMVEEFRKMYPDFQ